MKKILFAANRESFYTKFLIPQLKYFKENGYEVHIASKREDLVVPYCDKNFDVNFARSLNLKENIESFKQMKKILTENEYDIISCHTPFGGAITRLAAKTCKLKNTKIVYMAHGFHFYKGAGLLKWLVFYTAEKYLSRFTDTIITINMEDYKVAKDNFKTNVKYVPGVGLDTEKFNFKMTIKEKLELRKSLGLKKDDFVMIYAAELSPRKGQEWLILTLEKLLKENQNYHILLPGIDSANGKYHALVKKLSLDRQIHFLGFRNDIPKLLNIVDMAISTSRQEGLPVNIMEAIYCNLPIVATDCRGNRDLIKDGKNGFVVTANDKEGFIKKIAYYAKIDKNKKAKIKEFNQKFIQKFLLENVIDEVVKITTNQAVIK